MTVKSKSTQKPEDFDLTNIKGARLRFLPSPSLRAVLKGLKFERVEENGNDNGHSDDAQNGGPAPSKGRDVEPNKNDA